MEFHSLQDAILSLLKLLRNDVKTIVFAYPDDNTPICIHFGFTYHYCGCYCMTFLPRNFNIVIVYLDGQVVIKTAFFEKLLRPSFQPVQRTNMMCTPSTKLEDIESYATELIKEEIHFGFLSMKLVNCAERVFTNDHFITQNSSPEEQVQSGDTVLKDIVFKSGDPTFLCYAKPL